MKSEAQIREKLTQMQQSPEHAKLKEVVAKYIGRLQIMQETQQEFPSKFGEYQLEQMVSILELLETNELKLAHYEKWIEVLSWVLS